MAEKSLSDDTLWGNVFHKEKKAEKKAKKEEEKHKEKERKASVDCPYCGEHYKSYEIYRKAYKPEGLKLRRRSGEQSIYLSFVKCRQCDEIFGIEEWYTDFLCDAIMTSFVLKPE